MKHLPRAVAAIVACGISMTLTAASHADEGMWLLNNPPLQILKERFKFEPSKEFLEHMQKSAVRFNSGGSASFISADGLVMTNHHVGSDSIAKLSTPGNDLLEKGFHAKTRAEELKCPDLEINVLWTIEDVTDRVNKAAEGLSTSEANTARRKAMAAIESEAKEKTGGLDCQVVTLYAGGKYHLYCYKRYTDVRLVFAPEQSIAFFGGDADNFEYPRFNLDVSFFRVYENDQPLKVEHHLTWSAGAKPGDLSLVFGHPGRTSRQLTADHLRYVRDVQTPRQIRNTSWREIQLQSFAGRSAENARIAKDDAFGVANSRKAITGRLSGLQDPAVMAAKIEEESKMRQHASSSGASSDPWAMISAAQEIKKANVFRNAGVGAPFSSELSGAALTLVRLAAELPKPSPERLREYRETGLPSLYLNLYSDAPIYDVLEVDRLTAGLQNMVIELGADDPLATSVLAGKSPRERAAELIAGTKLKDIAERKRLAEGGKAAIEASNDPLIKLAQLLDPESRRLRKISEDEVEAKEREGYAQIAKIKFAMQGDTVYPDATFTLRMAFGPIIGWKEGTEQIPAFTDFKGLYKRYDDRRGEPGFELPQRWIDAENKLNPTTPFNFVSTADIIGGNSGSPVVNTKGELIGIIFDGNIHSLVGDYYYDERFNRAVAVDSRGIIEALTKVYEAHDLVAEILGGKP